MLLNVVIIGSNDELQQHLDAWVANKHAEVVGVLPVGDKDKMHIPKYLESVVASSMEELTSGKADVIDVCVPVQERSDWVKKAASFGSSIICPLPFGKTQDEERAVIEICWEKGVSLYAGNSFQFAPAFEGAHKHVKDGAIGKPGVIHLSSKEAHPGGDNDIFALFGIELFAWVVATFGEVVRVTGKHTQTTSKSGVPVEYAMTTLRMADGAIVHVELIWSGKSTESSFELAGSEGMLHYDSRESDPIHVETFTDSGHVHETDMVLNKSVLAREVEHYVACIRYGATPTLTVDDVVHAMDVAKAASVSAEMGEPVAIEGGVGQ